MDWIATIGLISLLIALGCIIAGGGMLVWLVIALARGIWIGDTAEGDE